MNKRAICLLSGGIDSSTLAYYLGAQEIDIFPLTIDYGQRHKKEILSAFKIAALLNTELKVINISRNSFLFKGSALTDSIEVPHEEYDKKTMSLTVVPNRNMILLSMAVAYAISIKADMVAYAAHSGDHYLYPDCRPAFVNAMKLAIAASTEDKIKLETPFINKSKSDIVRIGIEHRVPYEHTWSCYQGEKLACGKCGTCRERLQAFRDNNAVDPLKYKES